MFFHFLTDYGVDYLIGFSPSDLLTSVDAYEFVLINANNRPSPRDKRIKQTLEEFVYRFFAHQEFVMIYMCDTGDNKQNQRNRLFEYWFMSSSRYEEFEYLSLHVSVENVANYIAIITRKDNPLLPLIRAELGQTVDNLQQKPVVYDP